MVRQLTYKNLPFLILLAYIVFTTFTLFQMNSSMAYILQYPVRVSQEAREMITRLREMQHTLPGLFATPNVSYETILSVLKRQEAWQDTSFTIIKDLYRGDPKLIEKLEEELPKIRQLRREAANQLLGNSDYNTAMALYNSKIAPQVEVVNRAIGAILNSSQSAMYHEQMATEKSARISIILTLLVGVILAIAFFLLRRTEDRNTRQLINRDKLFNELSHNVDEIFIIATNANNFEFVTSNSSRIIGLTDDNIIRNPEELYNFLPSKEAQWMRSTLDEHKGGEPEDHDITDKTGNRYFKLTLTPLFERGKCRGTLVAMRDQTRDVEYQQALNDALKNAHAASQAKSSFLSHMSHEIRTPMNAIIGMTTIALSKMNNPERVEDCLGKIAESSRHLLGLINDVLDMSKIENGKLSIAHELFSLPRSILNINDLVRPQAEARGLNFVITQDNVDEDELIGDALRLNQILLNILSNALKFTPTGGKISLNIVQLSKKRNNVRLRFVITDTGIGMSQEFLKRIYKPFEQATQTTTAKFGGTGLGMSITLNLITLMGGTINVESQEGAGSKFTVELPFGFNDKTGDSRESLPPLKVLVVDDDHGTCEHASLLLEKMGLSVHWCTSGHEAVQILHEAHTSAAPYDVCFLDWKMPDMDGAQTAKKIRESVGNDLLIIIISAYDWAPIEEEAKTAGVTDFVAKPFFASTLYNVLMSSTQKLVSERCVEKKADNSDIDLSGKRILLVEDNEFNREIGNEFLDMAHATVENAENGQQAVDMFTSSAQGYYDLILMDVQMPIMDGYEATRTIRASNHPDAKTINIVAMTANAFSEDVANAVAAGMNGHIAKPIDINELFSTLKEYLRNIQNTPASKEQK